MENHSQVSTSGLTTITPKQNGALIASWGKLKQGREIPVEGIYAVDLFSDPITEQDFRNCISRLSANYGIDYAKDQAAKLLLLFEEVLKAGWTNERLRQTVRWLIMQNKYATWTLADFFSAPLVKLFPYSKYISELHEKGKSLNSEIQWYDVGGKNLWAYKKDGDLPFPKNEFAGTVLNDEQIKQSTREPADASDIFKEIRAKIGTYHEPEPRKGLRSLEELLPDA